MKAKRLFFFLLLLVLSSKTGFPNNPGNLYFFKGDSLYQVENYASAKQQYELAIQFFSKNGPQDSLLESIIQVAYIYIDEGDIPGMIEYVESAIFNLVPVSEKSNLSLAKCYSLLGYARKNQLQYAAALDAYETAVQIFEKINANSSFAAYTYKNAAQIYMRHLDYAKTIDYLKRGLYADSTNTYTGSIYGFLARTEHFLENNQQALEYYEKAIDLHFEYPSEKASNPNYRG